jgi:pSer/pThr/pTyr-binding forkhead associated (FHA) protein
MSQGSDVVSSGTVKAKRHRLDEEDVTRGRPGHGDGPSIPTPPTEQTGLALPPADAVTALRIVGTSLPEIALPPDRRIFNLGSDDHPDIDIRVSSKIATGDTRAPESVSRVHLQIQRKGNRLWIIDMDSTNGTFIKDRRERDGGIAAGETFRVGSVTLLAMDDHMRTIRPTLRWVLGFDAHGYVDRMLEVITTGEPLLLVGPAVCEQRYLAEQIHCTSARRGFGFAPISPPLPERAQVSGLAAASHGTAYLDLANFHRLPAWFVDHLFGDTYQVRPIIASPSVETATLRLGDHNMPKLRVITIPSIKDRSVDVPGILNSLFRRPPLDSAREIAELGESRLERLQAFDWPDNFDDLRRNAPRILAYIEAGFNERATARKLGKSHQSVSESLRRIGL